MLHEALEVLTLGLHVQSVLVGPRYHIGAAAYHRAQCLRASRKVADLQVQTFLLEVAELLGDGERQVVQRGFAPDGDMDVFFLKRALCADERRASGDQNNKREIFNIIH